jgi:long-chain acyl-CoA synthetase
MMTLFEIFQESAKRFETKTALINHHTGEHLTYTQLQERVVAFQAALVGRYPCQPGDRVGLLLYNQEAFIIAFFALQALGCIVVPLSTRLQAQELSKIADDAGLTGLITSADFQATYETLLPQLSWLVLAAGAGWTEVAPCGPHPQPYDSANASPTIASSPCQGEEAIVGDVRSRVDRETDDTAVLIYTSGTTGRSKGVMLSHRNLIENAKANAAVIGVSEADRFVTLSPLFHVFGLSNIMLTGLLNGVSIVLLRQFNPKTALEAITQHKVTFMAGVPTMYQMMLSLLPYESYDFSALRVCHCGAAPMPKAVLKQVEEQFGTSVQEGYGQSEASSIMTSNPLTGVRKPGSVGKALPGLEIEIVDEMQNPLPPFEVGELRARGSTVMHGYWNRPEATDKVLREGWLYTSDMGYWDEEGYIFLVGRQDDLINVGGEKVYPQEVEEVLYLHPQVESCAVTAEVSEKYYQSVSAYIVPLGESKPSVATLQKFCRRFLAEYKVPKSIYFVSDIPKGPTGKILRHQLSSMIALQQHKHEMLGP